MRGLAIGAPPAHSDRFIHAQHRRNCMAQAAKPVPEGFHTVTAQLILEDAASTIDWYKKALGAEERMRAPGPDGKIMHAEIQIGDTILMVNDPMGGARSPKSLGGSPTSLWIYVSDCDALFNRAA